MTLHRAAGPLLVLLGLLGAACGGAAPPPARVATSSFSCCTREDVERVWQPGETLTLHWIVTDGPRVAAPHAVKLTATLSGPYADAASLKGGGAAPRRLQSVLTTTDERTETPPVSAIVLPPDLAPGLYNLAFAIDFGGGNRMGGASVVRVGAPT